MIRPSSEVTLMEFPHTLPPHTHTQILLLKGPHKSGILQYFSFCVWLISLSIISSGIRMAFFFRLNSKCFIVWIKHIVFFLHLSMNTWIASTFCYCESRCYEWHANHAAMNGTLVNPCFWLDLLDHMVIRCLIFLRDC